MPGRAPEMVGEKDQVRPWTLVPVMRAVRVQVWFAWSAAQPEPAVSVTTTCAWSVPPAKQRSDALNSNEERTGPERTETRGSSKLYINMLEPRGEGCVSGLFFTHFAEI